MNFKMGKSIVLLITLSLFTILAACGNSESASGEGDSEENEQEPIRMGQINWAENIAVTNMWKVILEDKGYDVELNNVDMGTTMKALSDGELDASLEVWLPVQDANYLEEYKDEVNFSDEVWYENAKVGLVVPEYMEDINSVEDLNENKELFDGEITGFDPGAGTMEVTEQLIEDYELDYELLSSSEPAMLAEIGEAIKDEEPIVAPLWSPHRIFSQYDLKYLEDPQETFGGTEKIHHATRHGFAEDYEEVDAWLKNWKMDDASIGELMTYVDDAEEPIDGAEKWVEENEDLVNEWIE
ncbi:glycine betaine ABC transporter substrate-binding protein [Halobacillus seohaensis]|uniref:Glycine betaine ABC transporter substrate-binding protein n=1 Tax=Halobacillus seohaensis TaxID=447421 RepID=A0ABW2ERZ6_9BACI